MLPAPHFVFPPAHCSQTVHVLPNFPSAADPFAYDAYRAKRVQQKLEEERRSRISIVKKLPRVRCCC